MHGGNLETKISAKTTLREIREEWASRKLFRHNKSLLTAPLRAEPDSHRIMHNTVAIENGKRWTDKRQDEKGGKKQDRKRWEGLWLREKDLLVAEKEYN